MRHIGFLKADTLVNLVNWLGIPLFFFYTICMVVAPWIQGGWNWVHVQEVWDRWQTLNAGLLAFISSVIAFNIARFNSKKQRERQFVAARAFLPHALSELVNYFKLSAKFLHGEWERGDGVRRSNVLERVLPKPAESYQEIFSRCIEVAEPDVGDYLAQILVLLQVHNARLRDMSPSPGDEGRSSLNRDNIKSYIYSLAKLQVLVEKLFPFARGEGEFDNSIPDWEDFRNAYGNLECWPNDIDDLEGFTKRAIERMKKDQD